MILCHVSPSRPIASTFQFVLRTIPYTLWQAIGYTCSPNLSEEGLPSLRMAEGHEPIKAFSSRMVSLEVMNNDGIMLLFVGIGTYECASDLQ